MTKTKQPIPFLCGWFLVSGLILLSGLGLWRWQGQSQPSVAGQSAGSSPTSMTIGPTVSLPVTGPSPSLANPDCLAVANAECPGALNLTLTSGLTNLAGINLAGAKLSNLSLAGFDLSGANLIGATLTGNFSGVNFKGASAEGASLTGTFDRANFSTADLFGATLSGSFNGVNFSHANLAEGTLDGSYKNASFASTQLVAAFYRSRPMFLRLS
jgi:hypothetical protein